jgi:transcription elongation factor GreB
MPKLKVVDPQNRPDKVFFGAWVLLEREDESTVEYRIVGPDESDLSVNWISMDSPLAKALLRKGLDEEILLTLDERRDTFVIAGIRYE